MQNFQNIENAVQDNENKQPFKLCFRCRSIFDKYVYGNLLPFRMYALRTSDFEIKLAIFKS